MNVFPGYFQRKIEPKEILSCLIPRLLVVFTRQLEILVTTLHYSNSILCKMHADSPGVEFLRVIFKFRKGENKNYIVLTTMAAVSRVCHLIISFPTYLMSNYFFCLFLAAKNSTTTKTTDVPFFHPTSSWYKHPAIIIGISVAGFAIFVFLLLVIVLVLSRKWKRKVGPRDDYPLIRGSRLGAMTGSHEHSGQSTPDCNVVEDLEMESVAVALHRIRATEQFEMKRLPHLDF